MKITIVKSKKFLKKKGICHFFMEKSEIFFQWLPFYDKLKFRKTCMLNDSHANVLIKIFIQNHSKIMNITRKSLDKFEIIKCNIYYFSGFFNRIIKCYIKGKILEFWNNVSSFFIFDLQNNLYFQFIVMFFLSKATENLNIKRSTDIVWISYAFTI